MDRKYYGQDIPRSPGPHPDPLADELNALRARVAELEATLKFYAQPCMWRSTSVYMCGHEEGGGEGQGEGNGQGEGQGGQEGETIAAVSSSSDGAAVTAPAAAAPPVVGDLGAGGAGAGAVIDANATATTPRTADTEATTPRSTRSLPFTPPLSHTTTSITPSNKHYHSLLHTVSLHTLLHHLTYILTHPCCFCCYIDGT